MIDAYLDHLRVERRLAGHTLESYARDLRSLAEYAAGAGTRIETLDRSALEAFVRQQRARGLSPRSVARAVAAVRGFYRYLVLERRLDRSPADDLTPPRAWPALPKCLSPEDVDHLIEQPDVSTPLGLRDRAMIEVLYATGMRVSELVAVRAADLHLDAQYLTCIGKGNKERLVPIGEQATDWVRRYQREGRPALLKPHRRGGAPPAPRPVIKWRGCPAVAAPFSQCARRAAQPRRLLENSETLRAWSRTACVAQPARAAAFIRHASARARRRPPLHSADARPHRPLDDADLHARPRGTAADRVRSLSSARLIC
jgi:integrase